MPGLLPVPRVCPFYQPSDRGVLRFSGPAQFLLSSQARPGLCASQMPTDLLRGRAQPTARKEERKPTPGTLPARAWSPHASPLHPPRPPAPGPPGTARVSGPPTRGAEAAAPPPAQVGWWFSCRAELPLQLRPREASGGGPGFTPTSVTRLLRKAARTSRNITGLAVPIL